MLYIKQVNFYITSFERIDLMKSFSGKKRGLYLKSFEHDNCGIGLIANIKGIKSHKIVEDAICILKNLAHRGGVSFDKDTGDGAGILTQIPHKFMQKACLAEGFSLPAFGEYGVGMFFCAKDENIKNNTIKKLKNIIKEEDLAILGFRNVPINSKSIGKSAMSCMPFIMQIFVKKNDKIKTDKDFERKLFVILKRAENEIRYSKENDPYFYFCSLSCKTIVYKGMLTVNQLDRFYIDILDLDYESSLALVHSRFSTNTFPSWERAHPNRYIIHNGEINTIRGNVNWIKSREKTFETDLFSKEDFKKLLPIINEDGSDSAMLDNYIHMLSLSGYSLAKAAMICIPEPFEKAEHMPKEKRAFYEYNSLMSEPFDGPAAIAFTDGDIIGATLDRNGLRPARYCITKDDTFILSSEVGVLPLNEEDIIKKDRLKAGKMILIDTIKASIIQDEQIKEEIAKEKPYESWILQNIINIEDLKQDETQENLEIENKGLLEKQKTFGYVLEDKTLVLKDIVEKGEDPVGAMGNDTPLAVFSKRSQLLFNYFKQLFAQVTNPPIDAIREEIVTSTISFLGAEGNLLNLNKQDFKRLKLTTPILDNKEFLKIKNLNQDEFDILTININYDYEKMDIETALEQIFKTAKEGVLNGKNIIILSDKGFDKQYMPIPILLASSGIHHYLTKNGIRTKTSIVLETGEPREVHHFVTLLGYGANAINPYLAIDTIEDMIENKEIESFNKEEAVKRYINAITKGIVKVMSKMGISAVKSYQGAQIFEALGISEEVVEKYFTNTATRIGGLKLEHIEKEAIIRHKAAFFEEDKDEPLKPFGDFKWRKDGEYHMFNPETILLLQKAVREGDYNLYKKYANIMNKEDNFCTIRSMLDIKFEEKPIDIKEVESVESIVKRFKTGAMSYGSLSKEAHECLAIAMNRLGGKSNSGEGGEDAERFLPLPNGDSKCSAIKQVASGRFGVSINYLQNAVEIQIKMAQGAKPGEGGHLPGKKVYPWIAKARNSTPGVSLISPPPHHDIYSIEDLAQLIHDLKNANKDAKISVKLVSETGVGTIAVGVCKSLADVILISGYDGGTGAAPKTSIKHTGLPWEIGLCETHQALIMNNLRNRIKLEVDGKMLTGRDVLIACLLGAEEFGFSTAPLIALGCVMLRVCHMDTCAVGVATQNPELRQRFKGKPEYVENFMKFIAMDLREQMAKLGFRTINEMIGRTEKLKMKKTLDYKAKTVDLTPLFYQPKTILTAKERFFNKEQNHNIEKSFDYNNLLELCKPAIFEGKKINAKFKINNTNRTLGTILSSEITKIKGEEGLKEDTINLTFEGAAGQSIGAFLTNGVTIKIFGECNDYVGKGLSGGKIIVTPSKKSNLEPTQNVIIGNVALFGATKGEVYINGIVGERFAVRNSGATAVVEAIGEHGLEYMTGGLVVVLGKTGRNFGAGMSGGIAYVYDEDNTFSQKCNKELILLESLEDEDKQKLKEMLLKHFEYTNSKTANDFLNDFENISNKFVKVIPKAYKQVMQEIKKAEKEGLNKEDALMQAFKIASN